MEQILSLFIFNDTYVVSFLVVAITIVVVMLLLFNQKSPESIVETEVGGQENIEGALRRVLGEGNWLSSAPVVGDAEAGQKISALESEVLKKDRTIADLNKQLTAGGSSGGGAASIDDSGLADKIKELEARLMEYEIIEDDIADLSLYKTENEKLKEELERLKAQLGTPATEEPVAEEPAVEEPQEETPPAAEPEPEAVAEEATPEPPPEAQEPEAPVQEASSEPETIAAADLVAEFEKVVNNQADIAMGEPETMDVPEQESEGAGKVLMSEENSASVDEAVNAHPKLQNVDPDSKEEAEVFIADLKSLKKGS